MVATPDRTAGTHSPDVFCLHENYLPEMLKNPWAARLEVVLRNIPQFLTLQGIDTITPEDWAVMLSGNPNQRLNRTAAVHVNNPVGPHIPGKSTAIWTDDYLSQKGMAHRYSMSIFFNEEDVALRFILQQRTMGLADESVALRSICVRLVRNLTGLVPVLTETEEIRRARLGKIGGIEYAYMGGSALPIAAWVGESLPGRPTDPIRQKRAHLDEIVHLQAREMAERIEQTNSDLLIESRMTAKAPSEEIAAFNVPYPREIEQLKVLLPNDSSLIAVLNRTGYSI